ncbi:MAG: hypothetical protein ACRDNI_05470 [Gaiellaceae bacterium]
MSIFRSRKILAATVAGLAVTGGVGAGIAASQDDSRGSSFFDAVAKHLGISSDELEDATRAAAIDQVDAALEEGRITQERAEELKSRIESGEVTPVFGPWFGGLRDGGHHFELGFGGKLTAAAEYLGVTEAELRTALQDDRSLADVAESEGKSVEGLKEALLAEARTRLDQAVADEKLTREHADAILDRMQERIDEAVEATGRERWRFGFRGHGPGRGFGAPPAQENGAEPGDAAA